MIPINRRVGALLALLLWVTVAAYAGDVATFVNLGFSPDSRTFVFAQYGIQRQNGHPFAELFVVDVPGNRFVEGGVFSRTFSTPAAIGSDGIGALFTILPTASEVLRRHSVDHLRHGRLVYLLVNGREDGHVLNFRDFESGTRYRISLIQDARGGGAEGGSGAAGSAAFHLELTVTRTNGQTSAVNVGRAGLFRNGVNAYRIRQVLVAPDERSLVIIVERITNLAGGEQIRYMVETVRIP